MNLPDVREKESAQASDVGIIYAERVATQGKFTNLPDVREKESAQAGGRSAGRARTKEENSS
jgi:hypothetical protein